MLTKSTSKDEFDVFVPVNGLLFFIHYPKNFLGWFMSIDKQQFAKQLGMNIAKYRQQKNLTQEQLAELLGIGNEAISRIERGVSMPSLMRLVELANVFQCGIADLFTYSNATEKDQTEYLSLLFSKVSKQDRYFILEMVEKMVNHLKSRR